MYLRVHVCCLELAAQMTNRNRSCQACMDQVLLAVMLMVMLIKWHRTASA